MRHVHCLLLLNADRAPLKVLRLRILHTTFLNKTSAVSEHTHTTLFNAKQITTKIINTGDTSLIELLVRTRTGTYIRY